MRKKGAPPYSYFELLDACQKPGCPICTLGHAAARRNIQTLVYEGVNDYGVRAKLRESLGYCYEHAWLLPEGGESAALGIAIIHRDLLNTVRQSLEKIKYDKSTRRKFRSIVADTISPNDRLGEDPRTARYLPTTASCPACMDRLKVENLAFKSLIDALEKEDKPMITALEHSAGLCLPHLRQSLEEVRGLPSFSTLVNISKAQIEVLIGELDEFIRKNDHRFRDEKITAQERDSWRRALERMVGQKG